MCEDILTSIGMHYIVESRDTNGDFRRLDEVKFSDEHSAIEHAKTFKVARVRKVKVTTKTTVYWNYELGLDYI